MTTIDPSAAESRTDASKEDLGSRSCEGGDSARLSRDVVFEVLGCRRRRDVVHCLRRADGPLELRELSERIAAWENDVPIEAVTYEERMRVYTALKQSHLPKMDDAGVIEYDATRGVSRLTDATADLECYLDVVPADDVPWSRYYLGLGILSSIFVSLAWAGVAPLSSLGGYGWAVLISVCLVASALAHQHRDRRIDLHEEGTSPEHQ